MAQKAHRVRNWRKYNEALVQRGSITLWFSDKVIADWHTNDSKQPLGRPRKYSDMAITCGLTLKAVFNLTFRAVEGFITSLIKLLKLNMQSPDYSSLCKRQKTLKISLPKTRSKEGLHLLVDTTGVKVFGEGEWKVRQHGYTKRRVWRKLHLAINENNQKIEAFEVTESSFQDGDGLLTLLSKIDQKIDKVIGDGAYDQYKIYKISEEQDFTLIAPPKRDAKLTKECTGYSTLKKLTPEMLHALKSRDCYIEKIRRIGRKEWKEKVGYHKRSLAETAMFRIKTVLGNKLSTRIFAHQKVEAAIWCNILNRMTTLGMPLSEAII